MFNVMPLSWLLPVEPEDMGMEARGHKTSCSRRQKASRDIMSNSPGCAPQSSSAPAQEGQLLAESDNLVSQLSLAPLAVQSTYTPFEGVFQANASGIDGKFLAVSVTVDISGSDNLYLEMLKSWAELSATCLYRTQVSGLSKGTKQCI